MDKIVSLCRRRGFVFPSSEIYGGLGSTYDYGHYGVLMKNTIRQRWLEAMVQERDDIVLIDSAIILHPRVWEASGHVEGFTDPLVDCRTCKLRFREDQLDTAQCGKRPSKHPGEFSECDRERTVDRDDERLEQPLRLDVELCRRLVAVRRRAGVVLVLVQRERDARLFGRSDCWSRRHGGYGTAR